MKTAYCDRGEDRISHFNGATAIRPWKVFFIGSSKPLLISFNGATAIRQWKAREGSLAHPVVIGFRGTTTIQPLKDYNKKPLMVFYGSFNGATILRSWKFIIKIP